jgi:hypothetical protein
VDRVGGGSVAMKSLGSAATSVPPEVVASGGGERLVSGGSGRGCWKGRVSGGRWGESRYDRSRLRRVLLSMRHAGHQFSELSSTGRLKMLAQRAP